jgi:hypothetical protein
MSWLRLDDAFASHRKVSKLTDREFRVWVRVLCHCARYDSDRIDAHSEVKDLTEKTARKFLSLGLLEPADDDGYAVHDWILYTNAPLSEKVSYYLSRRPDAPANEIVKACGGRRNDVLAEVRRQRPDGSPEPNGNRNRDDHNSHQPGTPEPEGNHHPQGYPQVPGGSREPLLVVPDPARTERTTNPEAVTSYEATAQGEQIEKITPILKEIA